MNLLAFPNEIIAMILSHLDSKSIDNFSRSCTTVKLLREDYFSISLNSPVKYKSICDYPSFINFYIRNWTKERKDLFSLTYSVAQKNFTLGLKKILTDIPCDCNYSILVRVAVEKKNFPMYQFLLSRTTIKDAKMVETYLDMLTVLRPIDLYRKFLTALLSIIPFQRKITTFATITIWFDLCHMTKIVTKGLSLYDTDRQLRRIEEKMNLLDEKDYNSILTEVKEFLTYISNEGLINNYFVTDVSYYYCQELYNKHELKI